MATNIPPHNLGEVIDGCLAFIDNPAISSEELFEIIPGPDFPTAPLILGQAGARSAYMTGRGSIIQRCRYEIEEGRGASRGEGRRAIVLTSIPFQVGKSNLVEKIAEAAKDKRIESVALTFATNPIAKVCASSSICAGMQRLKSCSIRSGGIRPRNRAFPPTCWRFAADGPKSWRFATSSRRSSSSANRSSPGASSSS